jgi:hypothetical protein
LVAVSLRARTCLRRDEKGVFMSLQPGVAQASRSTMVGLGPGDAPAEVATVQASESPGNDGPRLERLAAVVDDSPGVPYSPEVEPTRAELSDPHCSRDLIQLLRIKNVNVSKIRNAIKQKCALECLQVELVKMQLWIKSENRRLAILFEGRDAAAEDPRH